MSNDSANTSSNGENEAHGEDEIQETSLSDIADRMPKIIPFEQLARCGDEIWIECNSQIYRLRRTRQGKLILTK